MPLTYNGFFLGTGTLIDPTEGNTIAENANLLVGQTYGAPGDPLLNDVVSITSVNRGGDSTALEQDNAVANDRVRVDFGTGGPVTYTFDAAVNYSATITYVNGTTASVTAVVFQTTSGELFLVPTFTEGTPLNAALTAAPIRSITLDAVAGNSFLGLAVDRPVLTFPVCFVRGTRIRTPAGDRAVESLTPGTRILTADHGPQVLRWIGNRQFTAAELAGNPALAPVRIVAGALGPGLPARDLTVSQQHRVLVASRVAGRMFGAPEVLVAARHLVGLPGIGMAPPQAGVEYWHLLFDRHEVVFSEGARTESLFTGPEALRAVTPAARAEILAIFPDLGSRLPDPARPLIGGRQGRNLTRRHLKNDLPLVA
ncbi:MAG TPA: Hint domain-containing protein [Paracoccaceae bacterium]|nr:Hint domain-containing protein [Paracoccaceae bacterium]